MLCAHFALSIFGSSYAHLGTVPLWLLILSYLPALPAAQYIAVCRATGRVTQAAVVLTIAAACQLGAVVIGGKLGGLNGLSLAYLCVTTVIGIATAPTVFRAAYVRGQQRRAATGELTATPDAAGATGPVSVGTDYLHRQQAGLATLVAIASAAMSEGHALDVAVEVWRTGSFPAIGPDDGRADYHHRQQAGLDALVALATPVTPDTQLARD